MTDLEGVDGPHAVSATGNDSSNGRAAASDAVTSVTDGHSGTSGTNGSLNGKPDLPALIEGLLFVTDGPVNLSSLARALDVSRSRVERGLKDLTSLYSSRGLRLQRTNGHVQLVSAPEVADTIERYLGLEAASHLSRAALETLSIVAYRQPVTRPEIDEVRGVNSEGVLRTVIARGLVETVGRRATVGHPFEYGTTFLFLEYFGLTSLEELPPVESLAVPIAGERAHANGNGASDASADPLDA